MSKFINIEKTMRKYSSQTLLLAKDLFKPYFTFYTSDIKDVSKEMLIEKAYDYKQIVKIKNNLSEDKLMGVYLDELLNLVKGKIAKGSRAEKYYSKAEDIYKKAKKENLTYNEVKDFTRIILCIYSSVNGKDPVSDFSFFIEDIKYKDIFMPKKKEEKKNLLPINIPIEIDLTHENDKYMRKEFVLVTMIIIYLDLRRQLEAE